MLYRDIIQVGLDIKDPISTFSDPSTNILNQLKFQFEKKCFDGKYILEVTGIKRISECIINKQGDDSGTCLIDFEVKYVKFARWEVINGCVITVRKESEGNIMLLQTEYCSILITVTPKIKEFKKDQIISIRVDNVSMNPFSKNISITGIPLVLNDRILFSNRESIEPDKPVILKLTNDKLSEKTDFSSLDFLFSLIKKQEDIKKEKFSGDLKKSWEYFQILLYPFNKYPKPLDKSLKIVKIVTDANELKENVSKLYPEGYYIKDRAIDKSKPEIAYIGIDMKTNENYAQNYKLSEINLLEFINIILTDYHEGLRMVNEFTEIYGSESARKFNRSFLQLIHESKID